MSDDLHSMLVLLVDNVKFLLYRGAALWSELKYLVLDGAGLYCIVGSEQVAQGIHALLIGHSYLVGLV